MQEFTLRVYEYESQWRVEVAQKGFVRILEASVNGSLLDALTNCLPAIVDNCVEDFLWAGDRWEE